MFNAAQIPFWFIWSTYFIDIGWLKAGNGNFNLFTVGSGLGTIGGLMVYIYGGNWLVSKIKTSNRTLNKIMAGIFILAGIIQLYRILGT
jgi:putative Ca2+/H+ antiporter (TMEM165/GDT1 family)